MGEVSFQTQSVSFVDMNPIALGDVRGSHMFIMDIFGVPCADGNPCNEIGFPDTISKERLRTVFIDRKFPEGYVFGIPETRSPIVDGDVAETRSPIVDGAIMLLRSANPDGFHLHVSSLSTNSGAPVFVTDSTTEGSQWQVEFVGSSGS